MRRLFRYRLRFRSAGGLAGFAVALAMALPTNWVSLPLKNQLIVMICTPLRCIYWVSTIRVYRTITTVSNGASQMCMGTSSRSY